MKAKHYTLGIAFLFSGMMMTTIMAQNVGISATGAAPSGDAGLDVNFTDKGLLIPRVSLTNTGTYGLTGGGPTNSMLVFNTNAGITGTGAAGVGYYYWSTTAGRWVNLLDNVSPGNPWFVGGNTETGAAGTAYNFGHVGNHHIDFITNNVVRGRMSNLGEFFIGTTATSLPGDLMNGVSNATFPWAVNGYSSFNGGGVYGSIQAGTTIFAGVQGEYFGTSTSGAGVRGIYGTTTSGTSFGGGATFPTVVAGVVGDATTGGNYKFGVYGRGGTSIRSGGVLGADYGYARGALGYFASNSTDYAVYGFGQGYTNGAAGGKLVNSNNITELQEPNNMIGIGIYGGVMGGWIRGLRYGTYLKGKDFSFYADGVSITNKPIITLIDGKDKREITYNKVSLSPEISDKGRSTLKNGEVFIPFNPKIKSLIDPLSLVINLTPLSNCNGLYVKEISPDGFTVAELNNGKNNVPFCWQITFSRKDINISISDEILNNDFEEKMDNVMWNETNPNDAPNSLWWDGQKVRFDKIPNHVLNQIRGNREQTIKNQILPTIRDKEKYNKNEEK